MRLTTKILLGGAALVLATAITVRPAPAAPVPAAAIATAATTLSVTPTPTVLNALRVQDAKIDVDINEDRGGAWYTQPVWIAIGVIALVLIIVLIAMAGRRDTTVVK